MGDFGDVISADASTEDIDGGRQQIKDATPAAEAESVQHLSLAAVNDELAAIDQKRRDDRRAYFRDEGLQQRERDLLAMRDKMQSGANQGDADGSGLPDELLKQWERDGGIEHNLKAAQETALTAIEALEEEEQAQLLESFDELPITAHSKIFAFMAIDPAPARPASDEAVETFGSTPEGQALVRQWGSRAAHNVAIVKNRIEMITGNLSEDDRAQVFDWFDRLSESQARAVLKALVGKRR